MPEISIISMILTASLVLACLFFVVSPYFAWGNQTEEMAADTPISNTKEILFTTLNELEFDHRTGKLSDQDYLEMKKLYEKQVAKLMKDEEKGRGLASGKSRKDEIEREIEETIQKYRKARGENARS